MARYLITKKIPFCYGHRLLNYDGKCKHLHGHNAIAELVLAGETLDGRGILFDFVEIKQKAKTWIDENLDHKLILSESDPLIPVLKAQKEVFTVMNENPTAENIAKWIFGVCKQMEFPIVRVAIWETSEQSASFESE